VTAGISRSFRLPPLCHKSCKITGIILWGNNSSDLLRGSQTLRTVATTARRMYHTKDQRVEEKHSSLPLSTSRPVDPERNAEVKNDRDPDVVIERIFDGLFKPFAEQIGHTIQKTILDVCQVSTTSQCKGLK
jgi:hypothetical protein